MIPVESKWKIVQLNELCDIRTGKKDANHGDNGGEYPFYTCADKPIKSPTYSFDSDALILPGNGANVGLVLQYSGKFEAYQRTYVLTNFKCDFKYLYHHMNAFWKRANEASQFGSATNYIRMQNFLDYAVPLPPLAEQKRIAAILDKADAIRKKRKQAIELTEQLLRATFLEMFGDPVTNPMGWDVVNVKHILTGKMRNGLSPSSSGQHSGNVLTLSAITQGSFDATYQKSAMFEVPMPAEKLVSKNDLLVCRGNGNISLVGAGRIPDSDYPGLIFPDTIIGVPFDSSLFAPRFLEYLWNGPFVRKQIEQNARTTNGTHKINQGVLEKITLVKPPMAQQKVFHQFVSSLTHAKSKMSDELHTTAFCAISQKAFRGEL